MIKMYVRCGVRTHAHNREPGALDRSANLTLLYLKFAVVLLVMRHFLFRNISIVYTILPPASPNFPISIFEFSKYLKISNIKSAVKKFKFIENWGWVILKATSSRGLNYPN